MAATVKASKAYDLAGGALREDLEDIIYDISPMDTWFLSNVGRGRAESTTHEWLTDSLTAAAANKAIEGDAFSAQTRALPTRLKNYTQISKKEYEVTGTAQKVNNAGMRELMAYHAVRAGKELKRDMELEMLGNNPASAGSSVSARVSGGVPQWIYSLNHIKGSGQNLTTTTAPASGFATADGASWGTTTSAIAEADIQGMAQKAWSCGGNVDTFLTTAAVYNKISAFTGLATRFRDVGSRRQAQIIGAADVYVSAFGSHNIQLSRYIPSGYIYGLQTDAWAVAYLRPFQNDPIAKVGDAVRESILAEWTLVAKTPRANTKMVGMT